MSTETELIDAAYDTEAINDALRVASWVGPSGADVTESGRPQLSALPALAEKLEMSIPESTSDVADVPRLHRAWAAAFGLLLVEFDHEEGRVATTDGQADMSSDERLDAWASAVLAAVDARFDLEGLDDGPELCTVALDTISDLPDGATDEQLRAALERSVLLEYFGRDAEEDAAEPEAELARETGRQLPAELAAFGALDENHGITALGVWLREELPGWGQPPEMFQEMLAGLEDKLAAAGVDPDDPAAMQQWLAENPAELLPALADMGFDDGFDFATTDLKEAFELPDTLPPVSLPEADELASQARTTDPVPSDADDDTALEAWCEELYKLLSDEEYLRRGGPADEEAVAAEEFELDFTGTGAVLAVILFLNHSGIELAELRETVKETAAADLDEADVEQEWHNWLVAYGDPLDNLLERLWRLGATGHDEESVWLLPLGRYGIRQRLVECGVSVALLPPPERMSAADLIAAVEGADEDELMELATAWLAAQDPRTATTQLLEIAAEGNPVERVFATAFANEVEPAQPECWEAVLDRDSLRPYAKMALSRINGDWPGENNEWEPSWDDLGWFLADTVASLIGGLHEDEVAAELAGIELPEQGQPDVFDGVWRSGHPHGHEVLTALGRHHPDTTAAKAARKAAFKAASANP